MTSLARFILRHRWPVVAVWLALTVFGAFSAGQVSKRWFESFSIPGYSAYEANQRTVKALGTGENAPLVVVVTGKGDVDKRPGVRQAIERPQRGQPGRALELDLHDGQRRLRVEGRPDDVRRDLPGRACRASTPTRTSRRRSVR